MKTDETLELEKQLYHYTNKKGVYGCKEVTLRNPAYELNKERVDYLTFDTKGVVRCYEIKVSNTDLFSKNVLSFWGNYNYLVMPRELYDLLMDKYRDKYFMHVGISVGILVPSDYNYLECVRKPIKKQVSFSGYAQIIESFARSASTQLGQLYK